MNREHRNLPCDLYVFYMLLRSGTSPGTIMPRFVGKSDEKYIFTPSRHAPDEGQIIVRPLLISLAPSPPVSSHLWVILRHSTPFKPITDGENHHYAPIAFPCLCHPLPGGSTPKSAGGTPGDDTPAPTHLRRPDPGPAYRDGIPPAILREHLLCGPYGVGAR